MISKIKKNLKYIKLKDILSFFIFILVVIPAAIFKLINKIRKKKLLLVTENGKTARDNGYHFYKYVRKYHPNDYCFYVIDKKNNEYNKVKEYGNIIQYKSIKHWIYYLAADYNISNQKDGNPDAPLFYVLHVMLGLYNNRIFLQHGITINNPTWLHYNETKFKKIICGAKEEYEFIKKAFGYPEENVVYTGFARFDNLHNLNINKNQILIMPTWRSWLGRETNSLGEKYEFKQTEYFKNWNGLLNDKEFVKFIEENDLKVLFYPHMNMQKFLDNFNVKSNNIEIVSMNTDIQKVLKESAIMITDYSSVFMDFAYMCKPILFFQFDYEEFRDKQYSEGYYDYKNGFGPSCNNKNKLVKEFEKIYKEGLNNQYIDKMNSFFEIKDQKNCQRIYEYLKLKKINKRTVK